MWCLWKLIDITHLDCYNRLATDRRSPEYQLDDLGGICDTENPREGSYLQYLGTVDYQVPLK
jgi:hypothetical protein